jgi:RND family efflux transporter MFP subunit
VIAAAVAGFAFPHLGAGDASHGSASEGAMPPCGVMVAGQPTWPREVEGVIYANQYVHLSTMSRGQVAEILKKEGEEVEKDKEVARMKYDKATIERDRAKTSKNLAKSRLQLAIKQSEYYEQDLKKVEELFKSKAATEDEYNQAKLKRDGAAINKEIAEGELAMEEETLKYREADLEETYIRSPIKGVITQKYIEVGEIYDPNDRTPMFEIIDIDTVKIVVHIPQEYMRAVKAGDKVRVKVELSEETLYDGDGTVSYIHPTIDPSSETMLVKVDVANTPDHKIRVGLKAKVTFDKPQEKPAAN